MSKTVETEMYVNPLVYFDGDPGWRKIRDSEPSLASAVEYLCTPGTGCDIATLVGRYEQIGDRPPLIAAPNEKQILEKLIWPLRHAKGSYMLGNYIGTISLCGMVSEMLAILFFDISKININGKPLDDKKQKELFGRTFEKLGQDQRVKVLLAFEKIDDETKAQFDDVRTIRRKYLHFWSSIHDGVAKDAVKCFQTTLKILIFVLGQDVKSTNLVLRSEFVEYLAEHGKVTAAE